MYEFDTNCVYDNKGPSFICNIYKTKKKHIHIRLPDIRIGLQKRPYGPFGSTPV